MPTAKQLVSQMTLEEKAGLCSGADFWRLKSIPRLGLYPVMMSDGPHGLRQQADEDDCLGIGDSVPSTCFPPACTMAASWDADLVRQVGQAIGEEAQTQGVSVVLGPGANLKRSPLCGRNFEYYSEDPYLSGKLAAAMIAGIQGQDAAACLKHFAANNQEYARLLVNATVDERALRELYLTAFEIAVREAQPRCVMSSYNRIGEITMSENKRLLTDILRKQWGFKGLVVSDWGAVRDRVAGVHAGLDLEMPSCGGVHDAEIAAAVRCGELPEAELDKCAVRVTQLITDSMKKQKKNAFYSRDAHHELARKAAAAGAVLLKNDGALPLKDKPSVAVVGLMAAQPRYQGAGSSKIHPTRIETPLDALRDSGLKISYAEGYDDGDTPVNSDKVREALTLARNKDVTVVFAGLPDSCESEGWDREHLQMPSGQNALIAALANACPNVVVVLQCGAPVTMPWLSKVNAVLLCYLGGQACGGAVLDLLTGKVNPSGKLPETFPLHESDAPCAKYFDDGLRSSEYRESLFVGYRYYNKTDAPVLFSFGHGLSYTQFTYGKLRMNKKFTPDAPFTVKVRVKNTGECFGEEVVQLYIAPKASRIMRTAAELKGFAKVALKPGAGKDVTFTLDERSFAYYNAEARRWATEGGDYVISVGGGSRDIRAEGVVSVAGDGLEKRVRATAKKVPAYFNLTAGGVEIPDEEFAALYAAPLPRRSRSRKQPFDTDTCLAEVQHLRRGRLMMRIAKKVVRKSYGRDEASAHLAQMALNSMMYVPVRSLSTMGGAIPAGVDRALVDFMNGHYLTAVKKALRAYRKR